MFPYLGDYMSGDIRFSRRIFIHNTLFMAALFGGAAAAHSYERSKYEEYMNENVDVDRMESAYKAANTSHKIKQGFLYTGIGLWGLDVVGGLLLPHRVVPSSPLTQLSFQSDPYSHQIKVGCAFDF